MLIERRHRHAFGFLVASLVITPFYVLSLIGPTRSGAAGYHDSSPPTPNTPRQTLSACDCNEIPDLISRGHEVQAAIATLNAQISELESGELAGRKVGFSQSSYDQYIRSNIKDAMDKAYEQQAHRANDTVSFKQDCSSTIDSGRTRLPLAEPSD